MSISFYADNCIEGPNLSNGSFRDIIDLLGYSEEDILENGLNGVELVTFNFRVQNLISLINSIPKQFDTKTVESGNNIYCGKTSEYYIRKLKEISEFITKYDSIYFA